MRVLESEGFSRFSEDSPWKSSRKSHGAENFFRVRNFPIGRQRWTSLRNLAEHSRGMSRARGGKGGKCAAEGPEARRGAGRRAGKNWYSVEVVPVYARTSFSSRRGKRTLRGRVAGALVTASLRLGLGLASTPVFATCTPATSLLLSRFPITVFRDSQFARVHVSRTRSPIRRVQGSII